MESFLPGKGIPGVTDGMELHGIIDAMKRLRQEEIDRILRALSEVGGADPASEERVFLAWDEVGEMFRSGLVRFGSHTESHRILTTLSDDEVVFGAASFERAARRSGGGRSNLHSLRLPERESHGSDRGHGARVRIPPCGHHGKGMEPREPGLRRLPTKEVGIHQDIASTDAMFCCRIAEIF